MDKVRPTRARQWVIAFPFAFNLLSLTAAQAAENEPLTLESTTVTGEEADGYRAQQASVSSFGSASLQDTPASISVVNRDRLADQQARLLSEVVRNEAAVGDGYAPLGYYENFTVRGFTLNSASSYRINGRSITGEQNVALENKEQVEVLKGLAGLQAGVADPGGLINYVTKRPADVRAVTLATNEHGERYVAADTGGWFGSERQFGLRVNAAHEDLRPYVEHANGHRDFLSLAFDWQINERAGLQLDAEYQQKAQRSVPGYQLLGGTTVPHLASPRRLLGYQAWADPVAIDSLNTSGRFQYRFDDTWSGELSASHSRVGIDDNSAFPYGFEANGDYGIYDFRNDDRRQNSELEAVLKGRIQTGTFEHALTVGTNYLKRTQERNVGVNEWVGTGNIYQGDVPAYAQSELEEGSRYRALDSRQWGLFLSDRIRLSPQWDVIVGGREVYLDEKAYTEEGSEIRDTQRSTWLPNAALVYKPIEPLSLYTSYSEGLAFGGTAYWPASNAGETLAPTRSRQIELGAKYEWQRLSLTTALFRTTQDYQFNQPDDVGGFTFVQQGRQENVGLEIGASGHATERLNLSVSLAAIRARLEGTGTATYEGHQAINVPRIRANLAADYAIPGVPGLAALGSVQYSGRKTVDRTGTVSVPGYAVFNLGGRYETRLDGYDVTWRLTVDNLFDKRYWRDVSEYFGDGYLFQGAPRTARLSATFNF